jgi:hypothetical protein
MQAISAPIGGGDLIATGRCRLRRAVAEVRPAADAEMAVGVTAEHRLARWVGAVVRMAESLTGSRCRAGATGDQRGTPLDGP